MTAGGGLRNVSLSAIQRRHGLAASFMATSLQWKAEGLPHGFTWAEDAVAVLHIIDGAFAAVERPDYFTDVDHCSECREHDEELKARPRMELRRSDLGNPGWDPVTFASPQGIAYLMPALARYTMAPDFWPNPGWYADQMVHHLIFDGPGNRFVKFCDPVQHAAIASMIDWMILRRTDDLGQYLLEDAWLRASEIWRV